MGTLVEHSVIDGGSLSQLHERIIHTIQAHHSEKKQLVQQLKGADQPLLVEPHSFTRLKFEVDEETKADISRIEHMFTTICTSIPS